MPESADEDSRGREEDEGKQLKMEMLMNDIVKEAEKKRK